jgi:hypothetical protein
MQCAKAGGEPVALLNNPQCADLVSHAHLVVCVITCQADISALMATDLWQAIKVLAPHKVLGRWQAVQRCPIINLLLQAHWLSSKHKDVQITQ